MEIGAAYIRVSTNDQMEYSPDSQLQMISSYAKAHEIILPFENLSGCLRWRLLFSADPFRAGPFLCRKGVVRLGGLRGAGSSSVYHSVQILDLL